MSQEDIMSKLDSVRDNPSFRSTNPNRQSTRGAVHPQDETAGKKDVLEIIENLQDDGKKSQYLQGHISKNIMDDTFLVNAE